MPDVISQPAAIEMLRTLKWIADYCDELAEENQDFADVAKRARDALSAINLREGD